MKYETELIENPLKFQVGQPEYFYIIKKQDKIILKINIFSKNSAFDNLKEIVPETKTIIDEFINPLIKILKIEQKKNEEKK